MKNTQLKESKVVIVVHEAIPIGPSHDLRDFFLEHKTQELLFIAHPLIFIKEFYNKSSRYEKYKIGKLTAKKIAFHYKLPDILLYGKDFFYSVVWCLLQRVKYDVYIGVDPLNAFAGLVLKKLGKVEKVVYYSIDYFTNRFENKILNKIYHFIDRLCVKYADETWNLSSMMALARERYNLMDRKIFNRQFTVPVGVWVHKVKRKKFSEINRKKIVFIGSFLSLMGIDLILEAMPIIAKQIPDIKLEIVGGGPEDLSLRQLAYKLKMDKNIKFHGWVSGKERLEKILSDAAVGLAPFNTLILDDQVRNADPAKLKDYMLWGMPVIVTDAIANSKQIENSGCGIVIQYRVEELAAAVIKLLKNATLLKQYRKNAISFVEQFDYKRIFGDNLKRLLGVNKLT